MPFVKLYDSILRSSVWLEDPPTRIVWITLLALAGPDGHVEASVPGLAHAANVPVPACRKALKILESPDPDSKDPANEGRRIEADDGGWLVLNYQKYREMPSPSAIRMRRHRARQASHSDNVTTEAEAEAEAEAEERKRTSRTKTSAPAPAWTREACDDWEERFGKGTAPGGRIGGGLKRVVDRYGWDVVRPVWRRYLASEKPQFCNPQSFASKFATWANRQVPQSKGEEHVERVRAAVGRFLKRGNE
jgi:hypothetical protein